MPKPNGTNADFVSAWLEQLGLSSYLQGAIATAATYSVNSDVNFIPGQGGNTASLPLAATTSGANTSYINVYTRGGNSCNIPSASN